MVSNAAPLLALISSALLSGGGSASDMLGSSFDERCRHSANEGWWPGVEAALAHLDTLACVHEGAAVPASLQQRVCVGEEVTDQLGRIVGQAEPANSCIPAQHVQQWLTTADGRLVPALQKWFVHGTVCAGGGSSSRRVLFFCGGGANNQPTIMWSGEAEEARFWATRASWMRGLPPAAAALLAGTDALTSAAPPVACEAEVHVGVPALCDLLPPPEWLSRYERLVEVRLDDVDRSTTEGWATGDFEDSREKELAQTHSLIEAGWRADVARGELTQERMDQLVLQLRAEAVVAASVDDSERPRPETVGANYDFTYGEISSEGCLMLADALQLDKRAVVYDLGSGFGRATVLFAMFGAGRSIGLELDASRHAAALRLRDHGLAHDLITAEESDRIFFHNGDAFAPGAFADATHIYMLSTCFGPHIFARFLAAISSDKTPHLAWVVSSRRIPDRLLDKHNEGQIVRCSDVHCFDMSTETESVGQRDVRQEAVLSPRGNGNVARLDLDSVLDVPTTFTISCRLYLYKVTRS